MTRLPYIAFSSTVVFLSWPFAAAAQNTLRAGFAISDLTPPLGLEMGGFGMNLGRTGDAVHDNLLARATVLELNGERMAIVGCDLGGIRAAIVGQVREIVQKAIGIPPHRVMVGATHTHSAPVAARWIGVGKEDPDYLTALPEKIARAVIQANSRLEAVTVAYGEELVEGVARNREYADGPLDPNVRVLKFTRVSGGLAGFIANYSVHPVVMAEKTRMFTGDLTGVATNQVMAEHPDSVGIFLQGSCGDIDPIYGHMPQDESLAKLDLLATRLARFIRRALDRAEPAQINQISMDSRRIALPLVPPEKYPVFERLISAGSWLKNPDLPLELRRDAQFRLDSAKAVLDRFQQTPLDEKFTEVQAARLGDVIILANPGETFQTFGRQAADAVKPLRAMVTGYTDDYVGYIPAPDRYDFEKLGNLSYPAYFTPWICGEFRYREDVGDFLVKAMVGLGRELASR